MDEKNKEIAKIFREREAADIRERDKQRKEAIEKTELEERTKKVKAEKEAREKQKIGNPLGFKEIKKVNSEASTSKSQSSSGKSQKM